jgi:hypothetical protein
VSSQWIKANATNCDDKINVSIANVIENYIYIYIYKTKLTITKMTLNAVRFA